MKKTEKSGLYLGLPEKQEKYPSTIRKALKPIDENHPRQDKTIDCFKENYDVKKDSYGKAYARVLENLGLVEVSEDKAKPTHQDYKFMESDSEKYLCEIVSSRAAGSSEILESLRKDEKTKTKPNN